MKPSEQHAQVLSWLLRYTRHPRLSTCEWERHTAVGGNTQRLWKTAVRNGWRSRLRAWLTKQPQCFSKERYLLLHSLRLLLQGQWFHLPPVFQVPLALGWCQHLIWKALPWCQWWILLVLGWCQWDLPGMRPPMGGHMPMMPGSQMMRPPARPMMMPTWPGMTRPRQIRREGSLFLSFFHDLVYSTRRSWSCDSGCFLTAWQGGFLPSSYQRENSFGGE